MDAKPEDRHNRRLGRAWRWVELAALGLLAVLCVLGAFMGAQRAQAMFSSAPLALLWGALCVWLVGRAARLARSRRRRAEALALMGAALVVAGSIWGSGGAHRLRGRLLGRDVLAEGHVLLAPGRPVSEVYDTALWERVGRLPFELELRELRPLGEWDAAYAADVAVLEDGRQAARQVVEPNRPLHYGGYHVYVVKGHVAGPDYARMLVKSDSGLPAVYAGMIALLAGAFWACWVRPARAALRRGGETRDH